MSPSPDPEPTEDLVASTVAESSTEPVPPTDEEAPALDDGPDELDADLQDDGAEGDVVEGDGIEGDGSDRAPLTLPPLVPPDQVPPVRRRKRGTKATKGATRGRIDATGATAPSLAAPSLASPLLSGRSLEPTVKRRRFAVLRDHPKWIVGTFLVLLVVVALVAGKLMAERAADTAMSERSTELEEMLADATPEEFLAFSSGVQTAGSLAERTRDLDGFVNVKATAGQAFIRFQPSGWWAGFTERCLVAVVREDGVTVTVPKTACIRVEAPPS